MFIKVRDHKGSERRLNINHIITFFVEEHRTQGPRTVIYTSLTEQDNPSRRSSKLTVQETVEQLDILVDKASRLP